MLIKGAAAALSDSALATGALTCYEQDGTLLLAVITGFKKPRYQLFNQRGRELEFTADRLHRLPGKLPPELSGAQARAAWLAALDEECRRSSLSLNLEEIWLLLRDEHPEVDNARLCQIYFGRDELSEHLALRHALIEDRIYFKRKRDLFCPRPAETVEELKKAELSRQKKARMRETLLAAFSARLSDPAAALPPEIESGLSLLEDVAADVPELDNARKKEAKELISLIGDGLKLELFGNMPERAFSILERIHHFDRNTNLCLIRNKPLMEFSSEAEAAAQEISRGAPISAAPGGLCPRRDLTALDTFTVDDASTRDMDDALSIEENGKELVLGIHITDVAALISPDSLLDREARLRATSIYCPDVVINMLPAALSEDCLSLVCGETRLAFSFMCRFSRDYELQDFEMFPSLIKVRRRLSYEQVDDLLDREDPALLKLYNIASALEARRFEQGGFKVNKHDATVVIREGGQLELIEIDESAPGRSLIGEIMVLANRLIAEFAAEKGIALVYRGQEQPDPAGDAVLTRIPAGPAQDYAVRSRLKKSSISFAPLSHATLGLKAYAQVTSPIRRYTDLLNQRQILSVLQKGSPAYSAADLEELCGKLETPLKTALSVTRESKRFWLLRYLQKMVADKEKISATVIRTDLSNPLVEVDRIYLPLFAKFNRKVALGEQVTLKIAALDPRYDYVRLEEA